MGKVYPKCKRCGNPNNHLVKQGKIKVSGVDVMCPDCQKETGVSFYSQLANKLVYKGVE